MFLTQEPEQLKYYTATVTAITTCGLASAAVGAKVHMDGVVQAGILWTLAQVLGLSLLTFASFDPTTTGPMKADRFAYFLGFWFATGVNLGLWAQYLVWASGATYPYEMTLHLVFESIFLVFLVLAVFTLASSVFSSKAMFLLGSLGLAFAWFNMFWQPVAFFCGLTTLLEIDPLYVRVGLVVLPLYLVLDTWNIRQEALGGFQDAIWHAFTLMAGSSVLHKVLPKPQTIAEYRNALLREGVPLAQPAGVPVVAVPVPVEKPPQAPTSTTTLPPST